MTIQLSGAGKRFNRDWVFRKVDTSFESRKAYAITGPNGSGKSTMLQVIAGNIGANEGKVVWISADTAIHEQEVYRSISVCAPYLEVIEEMTAREFLHFHASFKPLLPSVSIEKIIDVIGLSRAADKEIRYYSSGMKQRVKLAQAVFSDVPVLLLDEPCTNFDTIGFELYHDLIERYCKEKLIVVSSNDVNEYDFCGERLNILEYK